jgi:Spy/CpxP family protein refolding chaperone
MEVEMVVKTKKLAILLGLLLSAGVVMGSTAAMAQDQGGGQGGGQGRGHGQGRRMDPDRAAARMQKQLNLSDDQVAKIKPILADQQQQMDAVRADTSLSQDDRRAKAKSIMQDGDSKIEAVLTDQQKQQWAQLKAQARQRHGGGGDHDHD